MIHSKRLSNALRRIPLVFLAAGLIAYGCGGKGKPQTIMSSEVVTPTATNSGGSSGSSGSSSVISVPTTYTFASRFESGKSSVSYGGQTVRNLLVQDL